MTDFAAIALKEQEKETDFAALALGKEGSETETDFSAIALSETEPQETNGILNRTLRFVKALPEKLPSVDPSLLPPEAGAGQFEAERPIAEQFGIGAATATPLLVAGVAERLAGTERGAFTAPAELGIEPGPTQEGPSFREPIHRFVEETLGIGPPQGVLQTISRIAGTLAADLPAFGLAIGAATKLVGAGGILRLMLAESLGFTAFTFAKQGKDVNARELAESALLGVGFPVVRIPKNALGRAFLAGAYGGTISGGDPYAMGLMALFGMMGGSTRDLLPSRRARLDALVEEAKAGRDFGEIFKEVRQMVKRPKTPLERAQKIKLDLELKAVEPEPTPVTPAEAKKIVEEAIAAEPVAPAEVIAPTERVRPLEQLEKEAAMRMTIPEIDAAIEARKLSDKGALIEALGEQRAKDFERLDRTANTSLDPRKADRAAQELEDRFGVDKLTPEQARLVYGIGETKELGLEVEDFRAIREELLDLQGAGLPPIDVTPIERTPAGEQFLLPETAETLAFPERRLRPEKEAAGPLFEAEAEAAARARQLDIEETQAFTELENFFERPEAVDPATEGFPTFEEFRAAERLEQQEAFESEFALSEKAVRDTIRRVGRINKESAGKATGGEGAEIHPSLINAQGGGVSLDALVPIFQEAGFLPRVPATDPFYPTSDDALRVVLESQSRLRDKDLRFLFPERRTLHGGPPLVRFLRPVGDFFIEKFSITKQFKDVGSPETGQAIRRFASIRGVEEERGAIHIRRISKHLRKGRIKDTKPTIVADVLNDELAQITLSAERPENIKNMTGVAKEEAKILRKTMDRAKRDYQERGENINFTEHMAARLEKMIAHVDETRMTPEVREIQELIRELKTGKVEFVHIASNLVFEPFAQWQPGEAKKILQLMAAQKRKSFTIEGLLKRTRVDPETGESITFLTLKQARDITDPRNVHGSYARRFGRDMANLEIRAKAVKEGLAKKIPVAELRKPSKFRTAPEGFEELSPEMKKRFPIYKDYYMQPWFRDYLVDFTTGFDAMHRLTPIFGIGKMLGFANPLYLPMLDIFQAVMGTAIRSVLHPVKAARAVRRAIRSFRVKDEEYFRSKWEAMNSKPYSMDFVEFEEFLAREKEGGQIKAAIKNLVPFRQPGVKGLPVVNVMREIYRASWGAAWKMDEFIRMITYHNFRLSNFEPPEAAQITARFHGDYADVPPRTRQILNKFFFTPTFKITMANLHLSMLKGLFKTIRHPFKSGPEARALAQGLITTYLGINIGVDRYMINQGFERDIFAVKYSKEIEEEGQRRELVINFSNPASIFIKFGGRAWNAIKKHNLGIDAIKAIASANRWEAHPFFRVASDIVNSDGVGERSVYKKSDRWQKQVRDVARHISIEIVSLLRAVAERETFTVPDRDVLEREMPRLLNIVIALGLAFPYTRSPEDLRIVRGLQRLQREIRRLGVQKDKGGKSQLTPERSANILRRMEKLAEDFRGKR